MEKSLSTILHVHLNLNPCKISALQMLTARYCIFIDIFLFSACCPGIATVSKTIAFLTFICLLAARVNGLVYKNPMLAQANDFSFSGLHVAGSTSNPSGSRVTPGSATRAQHSWHLNGPHWLRTMGHQPSPHTPPSVWDPDCSRSLSHGWIRFFKPWEPPYH